MTAAARISEFTPKSVPHIAGSTAYVVVPSVSLGIGAARTAYAIRNLIHHYKINKLLKGADGIHDFLETPEGRVAEYEGARECLTITDTQKQAKLNKISGKYPETQLFAACRNDVKAASERMTTIFLKELIRGLSEILFPFVGPLLWTMKDIHDAPDGLANLFGCHEFLESWNWNHHLYPIAQDLEHPKSS